MIRTLIPNSRCYFRNRFYYIETNCLVSNDCSWSKRKSLVTVLRNFHTSVSFNSNDVKLKNEICESLKHYTRKIIQEYETRRKDKDPLSMIDVSRITKVVSFINNITELENNIKTLLDLRKEVIKDEKFTKSIEEELTSCKQELITVEKELINILVPIDDIENCRDIVVEIGAGVGGQEAMLFSKELLDLYFNYAAFKNWSCELENNSDDAGIGSPRKATLMMTGIGAFKLLQFEGGVHRVQRVPKTDSQGRMHTSTVSVAIYPQPSEVDIDIKKNDLIFEANTARGPGGQHVNKIKSAVRLTHIPTGIVIECQVHRSHERNRVLAVQKLRLKLFQIESEKKSSYIKSTRSAQIKTRSRNEKVRTYNYQQDRITDHRFRLTIHNVEQFLHGTEYFDDFLRCLYNEHFERKKEEFLKVIK